MRKFSRKILYSIYETYKLLAYRLFKSKQWVRKYDIKFSQNKTKNTN